MRRILSRRVWLLGAMLAALLMAGVGVAAVATQTTQTFTYTVPGSTVVIPARTFTQTVAIPTVTETVERTVTDLVTTTAPAVTTAPTTTGSSSSSYEDAIAYTLTPPAFNAARDVPVASSSALQAAVAGIRCGDRVHATASFTISSEWKISAAPSCPAVIDLTGVTMAYTGSSQLPSVWLNGAANLRIYGGNVHGPAAGHPGAGGILVYTSRAITWWGFHVHDTAHDGLDLFPVGGAIDGLDFQGEVDHWGGYVADDPHAENGTGFHGANVDDAGTGIVTNTRLALYAHDGPSGAAIELGDSSSSSVISGDTFILKAERLTKVSSSQVAGNGVNLWGASRFTNVHWKLWADELQGRAVAVDNEYRDSFKGVTFDYARASNTQLNPRWASGSTFGVGPTYLDAASS